MDLWGGEQADDICLQAEFNNTSNTENSENARRSKRQRLNMVKAPGFNLIQTVFGGMAKIFYKKNLNLCPQYQQFLDETKPELINLLVELVSENAIKFGLKLEGTYSVPHTIIEENRSFKTSARSLVIGDINDLSNIIDEEFAKLLNEEEVYRGKGSNCTMDTVDGL
ncbi:uncharacterized protein LOC126908058 [Daktulosphaira vitifoliae]|uniref:uncharacterized protein LOC126908058 n=1 Tax=Daktulosphaira vitifoliae TaxID=58002 RepID=UPI0021AA8F99|nr:uncharacterized protein LOC126908058 [Daktulosphaira vitifoliae]